MSTSTTNSDETLRMYLNDAQAYCLMMQPRNLVLVGGRGIGKGLVQAIRMIQVFQSMPRSSSGFVGPSYKKLLTSVIPSITVHFERLGFKRDIHYVVNRKPWKALCWDTPLFTPDTWDHTIAFYNGSVVQMITQDREGASNGMSNDHLMIDEAKFVDYEKLKNETFQTNRGNEMYFGGLPLHHGLTITCDMPVTKKGSWFLDFEKQMDPDLVEVLEGLVYHRWRTERKLKRYPEKKEIIERHLEKIDRDLAFLRSNCTLYKEYSSLVNLAVLGEDFIRQQKRLLPPMTFRTSILCQRVGVSQDGFYGALREDVNLYVAPNDHYLDKFDFKFNPATDSEDCRMDGDLDPSLPLIIGSDANNNINWIVTGQVGKDGKLRILKSFFTKYERKLPECVDDFCNYYRWHKAKRVIFYYDSTFIDNNYATHYFDFHTEVVTRLRRNGWLVDDVYIGNPMNHIKKNMLINRMFIGRASHQVLLNKDNNEDLLISIMSAGVYQGKKDKRGEKLAETEEDKLEGRTDGSDAFDTVCIGVETFPRLGTLVTGMRSRVG